MPSPYPLPVLATMLVCLALLLFVALYPAAGQEQQQQQILQHAQSRFDFAVLQRPAALSQQTEQHAAAAARRNEFLAATPQQQQHALAAEQAYQRWLAQQHRVATRVEASDLSTRDLFEADLPMMPLRSSADADYPFRTMEASPSSRMVDRLMSSPTLAHILGEPTPDQREPSMPYDDEIPTTPRPTPRRDDRDRERDERRAPVEEHRPPARNNATVPTPAPPASDDWRTKCAHRCEERNMDLQGVGIESIATDKAEVRATVEYRRMLPNTTGAPYKEPVDDKMVSELITAVQQEVSRKAAAVVDFLQKDKLIAPRVTKLRTSSLTLEPLYEYIDNRMRLMGYRATNSIIFRADIEVAGVIIDAIVERGVSRIDGVSFVASPRELNNARHVAIQAAVQDALDQAMSALSGLGALQKIGRSDLQIIKLDVVGVTRPEPTNGQMTESAQFRAPQAVMAKSWQTDMASASPVEGDEKQVTATVSMKIRF